MEQLKCAPRTPAPNAPSSAPAFTFSFPSNANKKATPPPDLSLELHALKTKIAELTSTVELLANATLARQANGRSSERAGNNERDLQRSSLQSWECDVGLTIMDYDVAARQRLSQGIVDVSDVVAGFDDVEIQQGFPTRNSSDNSRGIESAGDGRHGSAQRTYDFGDAVGHASRSSERGTSPRTNIGSNVGRAAAHNSGRRWSSPPRVGRKSTASDVEKPRISRTLSRGSIHVGFDLETRHDGGLLIVNEESTDHGFEQPSAATGPSTARRRTFDGPGGAGVPDFDNRHDDFPSARDCADDSNRSQYDSNQDGPVISGLQGGHYNIAFSLDT